MSFIMPHTPVGKDYKGAKSLAFKNTRYHQRSQTLVNTPPDSSKKPNLSREALSLDDKYFDDLIDVSDIDDMSEVLKGTQNDEDDETTDLMHEHTFSRLDKVAQGIPTTELSTESDGWMDEVFNTNLYGMMDADDTTEVMPNHIFLDRASPNNDLTPDAVISPLDFSTQINNTTAPLADKTNTVNVSTQQSEKPFVSALDSATDVIIESLSAFIEYFFHQLTQKISSGKLISRILPRNEFLSKFLEKNHHYSYSKSGISGLLNSYKFPSDADLAKLISYTDNLRETKVKDFISLRTLANFSNPLLKIKPSSLIPNGNYQNERKSSVSSLTGVEQLSIESKNPKTGEIRFELNKFKMLFNYHNGNGFKFTDFDREEFEGEITTTKLDHISQIKDQIQKDITNCFDDLCKTQVSKNFLICNASLLLKETTSSPSTSTKKRNFDLSSGNFISSVELLYHIPKNSDVSSSASILNYQSSISIYNKDHLIHQKTEPIIGFKINPQSVNYDTYNLKLPFQSNFWGGYLTWLLNGSDDDSVDDIIISQTIKVDDSHTNENIVTLLWSFNDHPSNSKTVSYQLFEIVEDEPKVSFGEANTGTFKAESKTPTPVMDSKLISKIITGNNNSTSQLASTSSNLQSHKRTRSKSFSEFEKQCAVDLQNQSSFMAKQQHQQHLTNNNNHYQQQQQQQQQFANSRMNQNIFAAPPQYPQRLNFDFEQMQSYLNHDINSAPPSQQRFVFYPPVQSLPQQQFSQSASNSPYIMQHNNFPSPIPQQQFMQPLQRPSNFKSQSYSNLPNYNQTLLQLPPMRFINVPDQLSNSNYAQPQLPTPPSSTTPFIQSTTGAQYSQHGPESRKSSLPTPTTPSMTAFPQHARVKQQIFAMENATKASRQPSNSSLSSQSSAGTIPFEPSPNRNAASNFKKMKGNFDQLLKIEFYQPPKN